MTMEFKVKALVSVIYVLSFLSYGGAAATAVTSTTDYSVAPGAATNTDHHSDGGVASGWDLASNLQLRARTTFRMCDTTCGSVSAGAATNTTDYSVGGGRSGSDLSSNLRLRAWASDSTLGMYSDHLLNYLVLLLVLF
ncbi:uncharacterized protein LOC126586427 isoform X2 [Malus sylvestris]|uniref:uncharacterized protein LOC126586427 isoform X2 n=1 Tax=Malus sylvestris TaxID=3752 RepID=UPI0021AC6710|nr:uncharacterized protein LOC126586427 isoform X2 [Malus sylvestris]